MTISELSIGARQARTGMERLCDDTRQLMRVAYDHQTFAWQEYGGISRYFFEVARRIHAFDGYDVSILSPLYANNYLKNDHSLKVWGKYVERFPKPRRVMQMFNAGLVQWKLHREPPDVVHETYYSKRKLAPAKTKIVISVFDMIHEKFPQFFARNDNTSLLKKAAIQRADHIICISENTRTDLIDILGVPRHQTSVIHLAHTLSQGAEGPIQPVTDRPYIAYVGERAGYKNFDGLIRAFGMSEFLRSNFSIVCFGGGGFTSAERGELARARLSMDRVIQVSGNDEILRSVYQGAEALVYPSLYEGFGLPPLEAMSADCPVVSSRTSSLTEVCGDAAEYFDPYQPQSIAISIERAVASPGRRQDLISRGRLQIAKFSWDTCATQTAAIYEDLSKP